MEARLGQSELNEDREDGALEERTRGGYIDWRWVEQNVNSRNSRLAAMPALVRTGLIRKQNETLSSASPSRVE